MNRQSSSGRRYRKATLAGYGLATAAGALTVGLMAGVAHPAATVSGALTSKTGTTSISGSISNTGAAAQSSGGLTAAPHGATAVSGSHGS